MPVTPQQAPVVPNMTGRKIFVTADETGQPEGNIDPLNLPVSNAVREEIDNLDLGRPLIGQEIGRNSAGTPLNLEKEVVALTKAYDLTGLSPLWGWWKVRDGASNSEVELQQCSVNGQTISSFFDRSGNNRNLLPTGPPASYQTTGGVTVLTGEDSASFAPGRPYSSDAAGGIGADGVTLFGVADSDDADTATTPQILAGFADATDVLLSLEQYGTTLRLRHRDSGGVIQTNATPFVVGADSTFAWCLVFNKAAGTAQVFVDNEEVASFSGLTFTNDVYDDFVYCGNWDGSAASESWDGQHVELGAFPKPLGQTEIETLFNYLKPVSGLAYDLEPPGFVVHRATEAEIDAAGDVDDYNVTLTLPPGRIAVGVKVDRRVPPNGDASRTLTVAHNGEGGSKVIFNGLDNFDAVANFIEDGIVFESSGGAANMQITVPGGDIRGVIVRSADDISKTIEQQGGATHCYPSTIRHSNGKLYRVHIQEYDGAVFLSDGEGTSIQVFDGVNDNDRYHNSAALIECDNGNILVGHCGHNGSTLLFRTVSPNFATLTAVRDFAAGNGCTYIHLVKRPSDGSVYALTRIQTGTFGAGLLHIEDPDNFAISTTTFEKFVTTSLRLYPRKLILAVSGGVDYLIPVWATRDNATWEGIAACYQNLETGVWYDPEGKPSPNQAAPYFEPEAFSSSIETDPDSSKLVLFKNADGGQFYMLNDALVSLMNGEFSLATLYSTADGSSTEYGDAEVGALTYSTSLGVRRELVSGLSQNSYRVDCQFLNLGPGFGILLTSLRGDRAEQTDDSGESVPLYYDWYGEDFRAYYYIWEDGQLYLTSPRDLVSSGKTGLTSGWLSRVAGENSFDVQSGDNWGHHTHAQATRHLIKFS